MNERKIIDKNEETIMGWHLGFGNIVHLISPEKSHDVF